MLDHFQSSGRGTKPARHRVGVDVSDCPDNMHIVKHDRVKPALEQVARPAGAGVDEVCVAAVRLPNC